MKETRNWERVSWLSRPMSSDQLGRSNAGNENKTGYTRDMVESGENAINIGKTFAALWLINSVQVFLLWATLYLVPRRHVQTYHLHNIVVNPWLSLPWSKSLWRLPLLLSLFCTIHLHLELHHSFTYWSVLILKALRSSGRNSTLSFCCLHPRISPSSDETAWMEREGPKWLCCNAPLFARCARWTSLLAKGPFGSIGSSDRSSF